MSYASLPVLEWLTALQLRRPLVPLVIAALVTVLALVSALRLTLQTGFESLLPESRASVKELKRVAALTNGVSTVFIVLEGGEHTPVSALRAAVDALVPELERLGSPWVGHAETGVHDAVRFLSPRAGLFLSTEKLQSLRDDIETKYAKAIGEASGLLVDLDDGAADGGTPPATLDMNELRARLRIEGADPDRYPDGYYQSKDGHTLVVLVRSQVNGADFSNASQVMQKVREVVARVNPAHFDAGIRVGSAGDLESAVAEYIAINQDLTDVGIVGALMIAAVVLLYYMRFRMVALMLLTIGVGVSWSFGLTELLVGHLNIATGFLFTIIAGNGINFSIIYMARYLEARRLSESVDEALQRAVRETWAPTLTAAVAAGASYGSLAVTDFRGFHDFGLIGGVGMIVCWVATYWVLPALLVLTERVVPLERERSGWVARFRAATQSGGNFGAPFVFIVSRFPRAVTVIGVLLAGLGVVGGVIWVRDDPMEYDLRNLRTDESSRSEEMRLGELGNDITGHVGATGMAILVDSPDDVPELSRLLEARRDAAPAGLKPFSKLHALQDYVPTDQTKKIPLLMHIRKRLMRVHQAGAVSDGDWRSISAVLPAEHLEPVGLSELPEAIARAFTETDGTRGRIVYISPTGPHMVDDAHYLFRWADSYRETHLPNGKTVLGSGSAVIYADMCAAVIEDIPKAVWLSFVATVLVVLIAFRGGRASVAVLGSLAVGVAWTLGLLVLMKVRLNFFNFVALPITFGIGVDYAVNVVQRYRTEGRGSALVAIRETGGAVILCSLTTTLGYLALVRSTNFGVRSLGIAAFIGEVCCLLASVLVLPAALYWLDSGKNLSATKPVTGD